MVSTILVVILRYASESWPGSRFLPQHFVFCGICHDGFEQCTHVHKNAPINTFRITQMANVHRYAPHIIHVRCHVKIFPCLSPWTTNVIARIEIQKVLVSALGKICIRVGRSLSELLLHIPPRHTYLRL